MAAQPTKQERVDEDLETMLSHLKQCRDKYCNEMVESFVGQMHPDTLKALKAQARGHPIWVLHAKDVSSHLEVDMKQFILLALGGTEDHVEPQTRAGIKRLQPLLETQGVGDLHVQGSPSPKPKPKVAKVAHLSCPDSQTTVCDLDSMEAIAESMKGDFDWMITDPDSEEEINWGPPSRFHSEDQLCDDDSRLGGKQSEVQGVKSSNLVACWSVMSWDDIGLPPTETEPQGAAKSSALVASGSEMLQDWQGK